MSSRYNLLPRSLILDFFFQRMAQAILSEQANKATFALHKRLNRFKSLDLSVVLDLFDKYIGPILNYGFEVWSFHKGPDIERVQLSFFKRVLGVRNAPNLTVSMDCSVCSHVTLPEIVEL